MQTSTLKQLKQGEFLKRKADSSKVYYRGAYNPSTKKYTCIPCDDVYGNGIELSGSTMVYVGFEY